MDSFLPFLPTDQVSTKTGQVQVPDLPRAGDEVDERDAAPSPAAVRQRRHRDRRKHGRFVVPVEVTGEMVEALVDQGDVDEANSSDLDCVGEAIAAAARRGLDLT